MDGEWEKGWIVLLFIFEFVHIFHIRANNSSLLVFRFTFTVRYCGTVPCMHEK